MNAGYQNNSHLEKEDDVVPAALKPYSKRELQLMYEVSDKSFARWLNGISSQLGEKQGRFYNLSQVQIIFSNFGVPFIKR